MTKDRIRGYCPRCGHDQLFARQQIRHGVHLFLTIVTFGLWLVSWTAIFVGHQLRPYRCQQCGWHKPIFRSRQSPAATPETSGKE
jgi:predicted RNA-binding Zn-ribbon protein involved in translation (DUF1610 family)